MLYLGVSGILAFLVILWVGAWILREGEGGGRWWAFYPLAMTEAILLFVSIGLLLFGVK